MTRRLVLSYLLVAGFVLVLVELPLGLTYAGRVTDRLLADVERDARVLASLVEDQVEAGDERSVATTTEGYARQSEARVVVTDAAGISVVDTSTDRGPGRNFSTRPEFDAALSGTQATGIRDSETLGLELAYAAVPIASGGTVTGAVRVSVPTDGLRAQVRSNWLRLGVLSALVLAAAGSFSWLVARWAVGPVESLETGASRLAAGDLGGRAEVDRGPPELRHLAATFNDMAARLDVLVASQRSFVADASHQLRTPLTALRLRIESLEDSLDDGDEGSRADLEAIDAELGRLSRLVEALLALARSESSTSVTVVDAADATAAAVEKWTPLAEEGGVVLALRSPRHAPCRVVDGGLEQILDNLIDNALGVAPDGTTIDVTVAETGGGVVLAVRDRGPGLSEQDRARATDRFWRGQGAEPGGSGLGLSIVAELAASSGGSIELRAPDDGVGLVAEVRLPRPA